MDRIPKANRLLQAKRFRRHDLHAFGTARLSGRLFRHGNSNGLPEICAGTRRLARDAKTERHRKIMEEMARAWDRLASEADEEASHAPP